MSYIQDNLLPNEKIIFSTHVHPAIFLPSITSFIVTLTILIYGYRNSTYTTTSIVDPSITINGAMGSLLLCISSLLFLYSIMLGIQGTISLLTTEFAITNRRIIAKTGFFHRRTLEILLPKIESISIYQNLLGRAMNFGNVTIIGTGGTKEPFQTISNPTAVRKKINQIIEYYNSKQTA